MDGQQGPAAAEGALLKAGWQPGWAGVWGRMGARRRVAGSLYRPPETITALATGNAPTQSKKLKQTNISRVLLFCQPAKQAVDRYDPAFWLE